MSSTHLSNDKKQITVKFSIGSAIYTSTLTCYFYFTPPHPMYQFQQKQPKTTKLKQTLKGLLPMNSACQMDVLRHYCYMFCVNNTNNGILK